MTGLVWNVFVYCLFVWGPLVTSTVCELRCIDFVILRCGVNMELREGGVSKKRAKIKCQMIYAFRNYKSRAEQSRAEQSRAEQRESVKMLS
uniref:Uncharacterized protein n=1 Tax=Strigamia maritima TaxID=126957 RepID=T1JLK9_STRMM